MSESQSYKDGDVLEELYHEKGLSQPEIAEKFDCNPGSISYWMDKNDIEADCPSEASIKQHGRKERPWDDATKLEEFYVERGLSTAEIADRWDCDQSLIVRSLRKHGVEARARTQDKPITPRTSKGGYVRIESNYDGKHETALIHRLVCVAEYGFDALKGMQVHHKNHIPWDNRPENLELLTPEKHREYHRNHRTYLRTKENLFKWFIEGYRHSDDELDYEERRELRQKFEEKFRDELEAHF